jgi:hypothetical protein
MLSCASNSKSIVWKELSHDELKTEVEQNSLPDHAWHYRGSDVVYHYLYRIKAKYFYIGTRQLHFKVKKDSCNWISKSEEKDFSDKFIDEIVFTEWDDSISGNTHLLSRGIIKNPLHLDEELINSLHGSD